MSLVSRWRARIRAWFSSKALDRDLDRELAQWVNELTARYQKAGASPGEARRLALVETGGVEQVKERVRDARPRPFLEGLTRDAVYAGRSLLRAPGLFVAIVVTLALGIGANAAVYSVVHTVLLQPAPYRAPGRLTILWANMGAAGIPRARLAGPEVVDFQREATKLSGVAAMQAGSAAITNDGDPEQIGIARVTWNFFDVLGVSATAGRTFVADDGHPTPSPPVVMSWNLFQRRFGGDPAAIGRRIVRFRDDDDRSAPHVSIIDERLASRAWPGQPAIGQRLRLPLEIDRRVGAFWTTVVGVVRHVRVRTLDADVQEQAYVSARQVLRQSPVTYVMHSATDPSVLAREPSRVVAGLDPLLPAYDVKPLQTYVARATSARTFTALLTSSFAFLALALAAVGLAGLMSYSVTSRGREFGVRLALGATPHGVQRRVIAEGLVLVGAGIASGLLAASAAAHAMRTLLFGVSPMDLASYVGAFVLLAAVGLAASWWPARRAGDVNPVEALKSD